MRCPQNRSSNLFTLNYVQLNYQIKVSSFRGGIFRPGPFSSLASIQASLSLLTYNGNTPARATEQPPNELPAVIITSVLILNK